MDLVKKIPFAALGNVQIDCIMVGNAPWFRAVDICKPLGFVTNDDRKYVMKTYVHVDDKMNFKTVVSQLHGVKYYPMDASIGNALFINQSGLYSLVFGSSNPHARAFTHWVTSVVLKEIDETGAYVPDNYHYRRNELELEDTDQKRWDEVRRSARGREDALHYKVVAFVRKTYPDADLRAGGGEHFQTAHARMDAYLKGYKKRAP